MAKVVVSAIIETTSRCTAKGSVDRERAASTFLDHMRALENTARVNAAAKELETRSLRAMLDKVSEENRLLRTKQREGIDDTRGTELVSHISFFAATPPSRQSKPLVTSPRNSNLVESYRDTPASVSSPLSTASRTDVGSFDPLDYIKNPHKCLESRAMLLLLEQMGITEIAELALCDASDIHAITMLLKPLPRKLFLKEMSQMHI